MNKKKMGITGLVLFVCAFIFAPFAALSLDSDYLNPIPYCENEVKASDLLNFLMDFGITQFNNPFINANHCSGNYDCSVDINNLIFAWSILTALGPNYMDVSQISGACIDYCENNYMSQLNQLWCRFICRICDRLGVEPCLTPFAPNPNLTPVTRCRCGEECCVMGELCCGRGAGEESCCPRRDCCYGLRCCESQQNCCGDGQCCDGPCCGLQCCGPEQICQNRRCVCLSGEKCGNECCPPDKCVNNRCEEVEDCPTGESCGGECCVPGECEEDKCKTKLCYYEKVEFIGEYVCSGSDYTCCEPSDCCGPDETCYSDSSVSQCCPQNEFICWGKDEAEGIAWCCPGGWECTGRLDPFGKGLCISP